jgi:hypothetical protein
MGSFCTGSEQGLIRSLYTSPVLDWTLETGAVSDELLLLLVLLFCCQCYKKISLRH